MQDRQIEPRAAKEKRYGSRSCLCDDAEACGSLTANMVAVIKSSDERGIFLNPKLS
jgi:hypothetical protein